VLRVTEVYTSEGFLHLTMPEQETADADAPLDPKALWKIPAGRSHAVATLVFSSHEPGEFAGYVHVKTDAAPLIIAVQITVTKGGVHHESRALDLGMISARGPSAPVPLVLTSYSAVPILVSSVFGLVHAGAEGDRLVVERVASLLLPHVPTTVATVSYAPEGQGVLEGVLRILTNASVVERQPLTPADMDALDAFELDGPVRRLDRRAHASGLDSDAPFEVRLSGHARFGQVRKPKDVRRSTPTQQPTIPCSSLLQCSSGRVSHHRLCNRIGGTTRNF